MCIQQGLQDLAVKPETVDEVIMSNVVVAGPGQNPARQAATRAGLPPAVGATTVNKLVTLLNSLKQTGGKRRLRVSAWAALTRSVSTTLFCRPVARLLFSLS